MLKPTFYKLDGIPVRLTLRQAAICYAERGYPPRAIEVLLPGPSNASIRQALSRSRRAGEQVRDFRIKQVAI